MSTIKAVRLDGQNIGIQQTLGGQAPILGLNTTTGELFPVPDDFGNVIFTEDDLQNLQLAVDAMFELNPDATSRATNALAIFERLITVAPASLETLSLDVFQPDMAKPIFYLRVAPSAVPAAYNIHLPFTADSTIAWAAGSGGGGGGGGIIDAAHGGTGNDFSGVKQIGVLIFEGSGNTSLGVVITFDVTVDAQAGLDIPVTFQAQNLGDSTTGKRRFWIFVDPTSGITLSLNGVGQINYNDLGTTGWALVTTEDANGKLEVKFTQPAPGALSSQFFFGPGPGTSNLLIGGSKDLTFV